MLSRKTATQLVLCSMNGTMCRCLWCYERISFSIFCLSARNFCLLTPTQSWILRNQWHTSSLCKKKRLIMHKMRSRMFITLNKILRSFLCSLELENISFLSVLNILSFSWTSFVRTSTTQQSWDRLIINCEIKLDVVLKTQPELPRLVIRLHKFNL